MSSSIQISLQSIEELSYSQNISSELLILSEQPNKLPFNISLSFEFIPQSENDIFDIVLKISYNSHTSNTSILDLKVKFSFFIERLSEILKHSGKGQFKLTDVDFVPIVLNTAIGAMRGIIYAKTSMTILKDYPLPLLSIQKLLKK